MSEWMEVVLEDITSRIGDGLHGTPKYDTNGDYFFIMYIRFSVVDS
jgi:type I restriction enzyme S subunit